jgi:Carbohydrate/starch-binding module (family 21)
VRFHSKLEHTISFLREDMPLAIHYGPQRETSCDWEASFSNFPADTPQRASLPVRVESAVMLLDNAALVGSIAVANIAFHKVVIARYTLDYWKTALDVVAEFNNDSPKGNHAGGYDHFNFTIKIPDEANLESKVLLLAVKYSVNGQEYWDNNNSANFQIRFKIPSPHKFNNEIQAVSLQSNSLAVSHKELAVSISSKPQSIPVAFENFANVTSVHESEQLKQLVNSRLSGSKSQHNLREDEYGMGLDYSTPTIIKRSSAQPFNSRYNFNSSLSAAIQGTNTTPVGRDSLVKAPTVKVKTRSARSLPQDTPSASPISTTNILNTNKAASSSSTKELVTSGTALAPNRLFQALPPETEKSVLSSEAYDKLLQMYCFVRILPT